MFQLRNFVNRLNIAQRFVAGVCCFAFPLALLFYFNVDQLSERIESQLGSHDAASRVRVVRARAPRIADARDEVVVTRGVLRPAGACVRRNGVCYKEHAAPAQQIRPRGG